jgi:hypothetical protein
VCERVGLCMREAVSVRERESQTMYERGGVSVCVRERVRLCIREAVSVRERDRLCMGEAVSVCVRESDYV